MVSARVLLICGPRPDANTRARLREAGAWLALWEPFDDPALRFQVNRALAGDATRNVPRRAERVPTAGPSRCDSAHARGRLALYSLSARGAFLETAGPSLRRALVHVTLPLPGEDLRVAGEVVSTNVPGNLRRRNLPIGMGIRFLGLSGEAERALCAYTAERALDLAVSTRALPGCATRRRAS